MLADLKHYFIASMHPAPLLIGFLQGPPPQFVVPDMDWAIAWTKHPLIDCPCDCTQVNLELDLPTRNSTTPHARFQLGCLKESTILISAGRYTKFQNLDFWKMIADILQEHPKACYCIIGISAEDFQPFAQLFQDEKVQDRLKILEWTKNYLNILECADIFIDTFPSGGGITLLDAMALEIPVVSFKNNYMKLFNQQDWSPAEEFVGIPELLIERGNFTKLKKTVSKLIEDKNFRSIMAIKCHTHATNNFNNPARTTRRCEKIYEKVLAKKYSLQRDKSTKHHRRYPREKLSIDYITKESPILT